MIIVFIGREIHILDSLSWSEVYTLELSTRIPSTVVSDNTLTYLSFSRYCRTCGGSPPNGWRLRKAVDFCRVSSNLVQSCRQTDSLQDERLQGSQTLNTSRVDLTKPHPKSGVVQLDWNLTGNLLLARFGMFSDLSNNESHHP